ncbi:MAG: excinuclease ABC subunit C [Paludibacteraceae bacterium]|nr:excinuclease ABC subunit C [Paludibacteraceae bacterium]
MTELLKQQIESLPELPGVYQYFNKDGVIIYVGKAKKLKRRVISYFNKTHESRKTNQLVSQIDHLQYIVVSSEQEAFLLENNLIKKYQPRYNILLKDGKTYPSICITKEPFPRVFKTRNIIKNGSEYYGPYSSSYTIDLLLELIHNLYPLRTCSTPILPERIENNKYKVCLKYHIHRCSGVCEGLETQSDYMKHIEHIRQIIRGDANEISHQLWNEMQQLSSEMRFEEAEIVRKKYDLIEKFRSKSIVANIREKSTDVYGYEDDENTAYITLIKINNGMVVGGQTIEYNKRLDETREEILAYGIYELRNQLESNNKHAYVPFMPENGLFEGIEIKIPERGEAKKLLDLAQNNVKQYKLDKLKQREKLNPDQRAARLLGELQSKLKLPKIPWHIECFDNSNISGSDAVAACVVYKKAKPSRKDYRTYNIKTVEGPDDYASMREVVYRRYKRMMDEDSPLPDLIIADGGAGQMESIRKIVEDELGLKIAIAGLAKNDKHRTSELLFGFPPVVVQLNVKEELFKLLTNIQDEVHRVAITFHRKKRSKSQTASELDNIKGIGEKTKKELLKHFKSLKRAKSATEEELAKVVGNNRASILYNYFRT